MRKPFLTSSSAGLSAGREYLAGHFCSFSPLIMPPLIWSRPLSASSKTFGHWICLTLVAFLPLPSYPYLPFFLARLIYLY